MLRAGERVGVGVSGGADSVALLLLLVGLREELGIVLSVAHMNHKLRGAASDVDERFVGKLAAKQGLTLYSEGVDVAAKARREKANLEDAARRARYEFFAMLVKEGKMDRVAVGHTADDQAETVLAHILRGTGLAGLGGIHPQAECVVRPLLGERRAELRAYLRAKKQQWREDATNQDLSRTRARIRKKLLPLLEREFQSGVVGHLGSLAEFAREDEQFLELLAREWCESRTRKTTAESRIAIVDLLRPMKNENIYTEDTEGAEDTEKGEKNSALTKRMLFRLIEERKRDTGQINAQHIAAAMDLARHGESGKLLQLPGGVELRREREELVFCTRSKGGAGTERETDKLGGEGKLAGTGRLRGGAAGKSGAKRSGATEYEHKIDFRDGGASLCVPQAGCVFRFRVIDWPAQREETRESGAVLDRDRLREPLLLRNWRFGDRLQPAGHQKAHKLKRLLNEKHVSRWERDGWPVLTSGRVLVWARGFPVAAEFAASEGTKTGILIVEEKS
ncbi:MAG: tRNA lysidine(34) synthetase TilS [Candidatus Acidiferrum sp.]